MSDEVAGPNDPPEEHEGVGTTPVNPPWCETPVEYTYEHVDEQPETDAELFRVVGVVEYVERPMHKNVYYVPSGKLDAFLVGYDMVSEEYVDIRPISEERAQEEIDEYRDGGGDE